MFLFVFRNHRHDEIRIVAITRQEAKIRLSAYLKETGRACDEKQFSISSSQEIRGSMVVNSYRGSMVVNSYNNFNHVSL